MAHLDWEIWKKKTQIIQCTFLIETMVTNVGYNTNYILSLLMRALLSNRCFILFYFISHYLLSHSIHKFWSQIEGVLLDYSVSWFMFPYYVAFVYLPKKFNGTQPSIAVTFGENVHVFTCVVMVVVVANEKQKTNIFAFVSSHRAQFIQFIGKWPIFMRSFEFALSRAVTYCYLF